MRESSLKTVKKRQKGTALPATAIADFRRALLAWYDANRRDLPWRRTSDPYAIWVSEVMLQQTRVGAVIDHYRIFLERFPDLGALAAASEDAVLAAWSGLGYYRRARMMHRCAREIVEKHNGCFPEAAERLRALPGIGRYSAAAIASIAFGEPVAVVDGNVQRVLQRIEVRELTANECWSHAQEILSLVRPGDCNQAMMELGATLCLPREPRCLICPIRPWCAAQGASGQPRTGVRQQKREIWCSLERRDGHVKLVRRARTESLMAGMWELPQWSELPDHVKADWHWRTFRHSITVTDYTVHVSRNLRGNDSEAKARGKWITIDRVPDLPITGLTRKILKADGII